MGKWFEGCIINGEAGRWTCYYSKMLLDVTFNGWMYTNRNRNRCFGWRKSEAKKKNKWEKFFFVVDFVIVVHKQGTLLKWFHGIQTIAIDRIFLLTDYKINGINYYYSFLITANKCIAAFGNELKLSSFIRAIDVFKWTTMLKSLSILQKILHPSHLTSYKMFFKSFLLSLKCHLMQ